MSIHDRNIETTKAQTNKLWDTGPFNGLANGMNINHNDSTIRVLDVL